MCWACYTPLSTGAAVAGAPAGAPGTLSKGPKPVSVEEEKDKKQVDPKLFAAVGLLFVAGIIGLFTTGVIGGGGEEEEEDVPAPAAKSETKEENKEEAPPSVAPAIAPASGPGGGVSADVGEIAYRTVFGPDPRNSTGTMGILAKEKQLSAAQAGGLARFAREHYARSGKWSQMQIAVFTDEAAANQFAAYQRKRRGQRLSPSNYSDLASQGVWTGAAAFFQSSGKKEAIYSPASNPNSWWMNKPTSSR